MIRCRSAIRLLKMVLATTISAFFMQSALADPATKPVCKLGYIEILTSEVGSYLASTNRNAICSVLSDNLRIDYYYYSTKSGNSIDRPLIQKEFRRVSGAAGLPMIGADLAVLTLESDYIFSSRATPIFFTRPSRDSGYLQFSGAENLIIMGIWRSDRPQTWSDLFAASGLNDHGKNRIVKSASLLGLIFLIVAPLVVLTIKKARLLMMEFLYFFDRYGFGIPIFVLIAASLPLLNLIFIGPGLALVLISANVLMLIFLFVIIKLRAVGRFRKPFSQNVATLALSGFSWARLSTQTISLFDAEVHRSHDLTVFLSRPNSQRCTKCRSVWIVNSISKASETMQLSKGSKDKFHFEPTAGDIDITQRDRLLRNAATDITPAICGCPKCGSVDHIDESNLKQLDEHFRSEARTGTVVGLLFGFLIAVCAGILYAFDRLKLEEAPYVGSIMKFVFHSVLGGAAGFSVEMVIAAIVILTLSLMQLRSPKKRRLPGIWVCQDDGYMIEDIREKITNIPQCSMCRKSMTPGNLMKLVEGR